MDKDNRGAWTYLYILHEALPAGPTKTALLDAMGLLVGKMSVEEKTSLANTLKDRAIDEKPFVTLDVEPIIEPIE